MGFRVAAPALKFLFENNSFGIFFKVLTRGKFFSALTGRVIERGLFWNNARACKLFSLSAICGEEMRDCAEPLSEVMKNLFGGSARKDSDEFLAVGRSYFWAVIVQGSSRVRIRRDPGRNSWCGCDR